MKDVFAHLQKSMQQDLESNRSDGVASNLAQQLPDQNSNDMTANGHFQNNRSTWTTAFQTAKSKYSDGPLMHFLSEYKPSCEVVQTMLQELHNERLKIINEIESEEKERVWFLNQLERLKREEQCLTLADNYTADKEGACSELKQEACQLRELMQQKFGSDNDIIRRYDVRSQNLQLIDQEMNKLREQTQKFANSRNNVENGDPKIKENISGVNFQKDCISPLGNKSSNMTTSATQTTIDLYPTDSVSSNGHVNGDNNLSAFCHGTWPLEKVALWHSGPSTVGEMNSSLLGMANQETSSVMSFTSSMNSSCTARRVHMHQLGTKVEVVYSLLSLLGSHDKDEMSKRLLAMSSSKDSCVAMRQSGCMPLLIQLLYGGEKESSSPDACSNREVRMRASKALHNIVHAHPDDKRGRREARVLRLLEQIRDYCDSLQENSEMEKNNEHNSSVASNMEQHPGPAMAALMKLSFDEEHRHAMCQLGGLQAIAELIEVDYAVHGNTNDQYCVTSRRYAGMALTNLTFGDGTNKALLCSFKMFLCALVAQLHSPSEDLRQVVSSVLRNLSWRADPASKKMLREVGAVTTLMKAAMEGKKESTLKSILSALWNLSAHCSTNKADICAVDGALAFLVSTLTYKSSSKTLAIIENGGGILRNISSQIAVREDYRAVLRQHNCLQILLQHLRSSSLTIVSNACGTLWNLSARCVKDQQTLWEMGAVSMLRNLVHSKHKMISMGSSAALKNLLAAKPQGMALATPGIDGQKANVPSLLVRKQRALEAEIDQNLAETCDNIDSPKSSPTHRIDSRYSLPVNGHHNSLHCSIDGQSGLRFMSRSASKDSVSSTHSDLVLSQMDDGEFRIQKVSEENQCSGWKQESTDGFYKAGLTSQESSRIAQVVKEVVRQVALEDDLSTSLDRKFSGPNGDKNLLSYNSILTSPYECDGNGASQAGSHSIYDKYSDFSSKYNNRNSNDFSCQEEREKCSFKYTDKDKKVDNCDKLQKEKCQVEVLNKQQNKLTNRHWQGINERCHKPESEDGKALYSAYNETDVEDQPTNYSLRYHEENDDSDNYRPPAPKPVYYPNSFGDKNPSVHDDTMTTYCMEGTPLNFSNATSMSDLRDVRDKSSPDKNAKSECSYGDSEKPVTYCVEGTPVCFSRVSSLSSILSGDKEIEIGEEDLKDNSKEGKNDESVDEDKPMRVQNDCKEIKEVKSVSFGEENVAEETPLMFSRCSSLGSLSSFDQHSIHDDRSSVISDFSRRASGALSPSDLPDSPSQTMPCSPKRIKDNIDFSSKSNSEQKQSTSDPFSDTIRAYATEDTPNGFSTATSLSSLVIYDEKPNELEEKINVEKSNHELHLQDLDSPTAESTEIKQLSDGEENEDEMLAACINSGMPNNSKQNQRKYNNSKLLSKVNKISGIPRAKTSGIPIKANNVRDGRSPLNAATSFTPPTSTCKQMNDLRESKENASKGKGEYCNSLESDYDKSEEMMLAECIQSGMPKNKMQRNDSYDPAGGDRGRNSASSNRILHRPRSSAPANRNVQAKNTNGFVSCSSDSMKVYADEGTPRNMSGFSSLSDLTIDSMGDRPKGKVNRKPSKQPVEYLDAAPDSLHNYAEEGTPGIISRQDSLSSLSIIDDEIGQERRAHKENMLYRITGKYNIGANSGRNHSVPAEDKNTYYQNTDPSNNSKMNSGERSVFQDFEKSYLVENTPVCFSNNSPLSALSIESICEPSAAEQALLDECISSGMPQNKNSVLEKKKRKNHVDGRCKEQKKIEKHEVVADSNGNCKERNLTVDAENKLGRTDDSCQETISQAHHTQNRQEKKTEEPFSGESSHEIVADKYEQIAGLSESKVFQMEAGRLAEQIEEQASNLPESMNQSAASLDLDDVKPPSMMGDLPSINCSMVNSCSSEKSTTAEFKNQRNLETSGGNFRRSGIPVHKNIDQNKIKNVPEVVRRALITSTEASKGQDNENSCFSDLLENVQPPSVMEDVDLISSMYSVASIASEVVEVRSEAVSPKGSYNSEVLFDAIRPAVAMAEFYAREATIGSMRSSCNSEFIENVNPPSMMHDLTEYNSTNNDVTATLGSDTDTDNELPEDDAADLEQTYVNDSNKHSRGAKGHAGDNSTDVTNKSQASEHSLEITPEVVQALQENANLVVSTLIECKQNAYNEDSSFNEDIFIECETLSLVSNDSESERSDSEVLSAPDIMACRRPRILKPSDIQNRSPSFQADNEAASKAIRGKRRSVTKPRPKPSSIPPPRCESPRARDTAVKPTRTTALRTTQNQQKNGVNVTKHAGVNSSALPRKTSNSIVTPRVVVRGETFRVNDKNRLIKNEADVETNDDKPKPPVKQGTFTKDKPSQSVAPKISPTKIKQPSTNGSGENRLRKVQSRSLDDRNATNNSNAKNNIVGGVNKTSYGRRVQTPSPMNRKASSSMSNLKKGSTVPTMKNSASNQSIGVANGRKTPTGNQRSRSGSLNNGSNLSLSSNNSTASSKKTSGSNLVKKQVVSKVAAMWKKNSDDKDTTKTTAKKHSIGLPRSSTYEKIPSGVVESEAQVAGLKLEEKNQSQNKTFTKSPSVDSKLGSIIPMSREVKAMTRNEDGKSKSSAEISKPFNSGQQLARPKTLNAFSANEDGKQRLEAKTAAAAAIVAPFNYIPNSARGKSLIPTPTKINAPSLIKHRDPCEMQIRDEQPQPQPKTNTCLITTV